MARPNPLDDPAYAQSVAELFASGASRKDMCEILGVQDKDTITRWRRDPRVKVRIQKLIDDRVIQISRKVDASIEARLASAEKMTVDELIKIRKEYGGSSLVRTEKADDATFNAAMDALEDNPNLADELEELLTKSAEKRAPQDA